MWPALQYSADTRPSDSIFDITLGNQGRCTEMSHTLSPVPSSRLSRGVNRMRLARNGAEYGVSPKTMVPARAWRHRSVPVALKQ